MGRLPRHVHRPVRHLGRREHRAGQEELRDDADRALPARLALGLLRHLGVRSGGPRRADGRRRRIRRRAGAPAARLELGLSLDDHGQGPVHRRRRRRRLGPQVLLGLARRRPHRRARRWSSSRSTTRTGSPSSTPRPRRTGRGDLQAGAHVPRAQGLHHGDRHQPALHHAQDAAVPAAEDHGRVRRRRARPTTTPTTRCSRSRRRSSRC